jgi:hypothetical protein
MPHHESDANLQDLWSRRNSLNESEWTRLYGIVLAALKSYRPDILSSLVDDHDVYVQEFFQDKVFRPDLLSRLDHVGAIRVAYKRYLHDRYDSEKVRRTEEITEEYSNGEAPAETNENANCNSDDGNEFKALSYAGFTPQAVSESATRWLREAAAWVPAMLGFHFCPDREHSEPLVRLSNRLGTRSYHYKAEKLGITGIRDRTWGRETLIGRWLTKDVGIEIADENLSLVHAALKILCYAALTWAAEQEAAP